MRRSVGVGGIILAGGQSRRFGTDKAALPMFHTTLLETTIARLGAVAQEIIVVGRSANGQSPRQNVSFIPDRLPGQGPMPALLTGLKACAFPTAVVVSCDLPFLNPNVLQFLITRFHGTHAYACVPCVHNTPQVLQAVYSRDATRSLQSLVAHGERRLSRLLDVLDPVEYVQESELKALDPELHSFFNLNTREDYRTARAILKSQLQKGPATDLGSEDGLSL